MKLNTINYNVTVVKSYNNQYYNYFLIKDVNINIVINVILILYLDIYKGIKKHYSK